MIRFLALFAILLAAPAWAQINIPEESDQHTPLIADCSAAAPKNGTIQVVWRWDNGTKPIVCPGNVLHVWAGPGEHWLEATVVTQTFREVTVLIPDPTAPLDISKAKTEKIKVNDTLAVARWEKKFRIRGDVPVPPGPAPGPGPVPPPGPGPAPDGLPSTLRSLMKATPAYSKDKALKIADVYEAVAAQAVATQGMDLNAFTVKTKEGLSNSIGVEEVADWGPSFFRPLSEVQAKLANERGIKSNDSAKLAALWRETATAIKAAVY